MRGQHSEPAFNKTYNSFSGVDMKATFGGKIIGELQGISYTVQREKAPIYTMGNANPRSFSRGKRGIAGSVVFSVFDKNALLGAMRDRPYIGSRYSVPEDFVIDDVDINSIDVLLGAGLSTAAGGVAPTVSKIALDQVLATPQYLDQVLPFDIVITASSEYGAVARMAIHGVEILNAGSSMSVDDMTTDVACTWIGTSITDWADTAFISINNDGRSTTITP